MVSQAPRRVPGIRDEGLPQSSAQTPEYQLSKISIAARGGTFLSVI